MGRKKAKPAKRSLPAAASPARPHLPPPPRLAAVRSECHGCARLIVFGDFGRLEKPTGWIWSTEPGAHLQPLCSHCHSLLAKEQG